MYAIIVMSPRVIDDIVFRSHYIWNTVQFISVTGSRFMKET